MRFEEDALLPELIELRISIQEARRDELIEASHCQRWRDGEEDIVKGKCPGFKDDLARKGVLERVLPSLVKMEQYWGMTDPKLGHIQHDILVEGVEDDLGDSLVTPGAMDQQEFS